MDNEHAKALSQLGASKGGLARARKLSPEELSEQGRRAVEARWEKVGIRRGPRATHTGTLKLGDLEIDCAVLETGDRVLSQRGVLTALGITKGGQLSAARADAAGGAVLPLFLAYKSLRPFIHSDLVEVLSNPVRYVPSQGGRLAYGLKAQLIPQVCEVWLKARDADALSSKTQSAIAAKADILMRALGHVGIVALVDEATGYQDIRARDALAKILEAFVAKELRKWVSTFRPDYYKELCRLRNWPFRENFRFPRYAGKLTDDLVYKRLAPGVRDELRRLNPTDRTGRRKAKHFQWLTEDIGHPRLGQHVAAVTALMKASDDWDTFGKMVDRALPRCPEMPLFEDSKLNPS